MFAQFKPWQVRAIGGGLLVFAGIPLVMQYNYEFYEFKEFGSDALGILMPLYFLAIGVWLAGFWVIGKSLEDHYLLAVDAFGKGCVLLVNCFMVMNLFPDFRNGLVPTYASACAFWLPLFGVILHWLAGTLTLWPHVAARIRIDRILLVIAVILAMGYVLSVTDYFMYENALKKELGWEQADLYRFVMAESAGLTMVAIMYAWGAKLARWDWGL